MRTVLAWAIQWRSDTRLDGRQRHLLGTPDHPCRTLLFETRQQARAYVAEKYDYIKGRPDLRAEPHGWRMPLPIRVKVEISAP